MSFPIRIPLVEKGNDLPIDLEPGQPLFLVGANGSGKSALLDRLSRDKANSGIPVVRITAHRQVWFASSSISLTPQQHQQLNANLKDTGLRPEARYLDNYSGDRVSSSLFELASQIQAREHAIATAVDGIACDLDKAKQMRSPLREINELFSAAGLSVSLELIQGTFGAHTAGAQYPANRMSDGERSAFLIAASVLTAAPSSLMLIDEPERHLHRSIAAKLLREVVAARSDCTFIISTHDLQLVTEGNRTRSVILRSCQFEHGLPVRWDADLLDHGNTIPEDLRALILGSRRKLLFVEGAKTSLDLPLYKCLFPDVTICPVAGCEDVERCVKGLRETADHHWVKACGVIDRDFRTPEQVEALQQKGIFALGVHSVEAVYYEPAMQQIIAAGMGEVTGKSPATTAEEARTASLAVLRISAAHLAAERARSRFRDAAAAIADSSESVCLQLEPFAKEERDRLADLMANKDLEAIASDYPLKETGVIKAAAQAIGFNRREDYESAVLKVLSAHGPEWHALRLKFAGLLRELGCALPVEAAEPLPAT